MVNIFIEYLLDDPPAERVTQCAGNGGTDCQQVRETGCCGGTPDLLPGRKPGHGGAGYLQIEAVFIRCTAGHRFTGDDAGSITGYRNYYIGRRGESIIGAIEGTAAGNLSPEMIGGIRR